MQGALGLLTICSVILCHSAMAQEEWKLVTFNAALQFSIPMKALRREDLLRGLKASDADVYCLQEVYHGSDIQWLREQLSDEFPHYASFLGQGTWCKQSDVLPFLQCISNQCSGFNTSVHEDRLALFVCLQENCAREVFSLTQDCLTCFFLHPNLVVAMQVCLDPKTQMNVPGLVLFSRLNVLSTDAQYHHPGVIEIAKQGYITANIETIGTVVCTHLATPFLGDLYPEAFLPYGNYVIQNRAEVDKLLIAFKDTKPLILAGDFNTGPRLPDIDVCEYNPDSYRVLTSNEANLKHTILDKCTFCDDNTWNEQKCDLTIDHVFFRGHTLKDIKRIFDEPTIIERGNRYHISDHYGAMATFVVDQF